MIPEDRGICMNFHRLKYIACLLFVVLAGGLLTYLFFKYVLMLVMPFLLAWGFAFLLRPPAAFISSRTGIGVRIVRPVLAVIIAAGTFAVIGFGTARLLREVVEIVTSFGEGEDFRAFLNDFLLSGGIFNRLFGEVGDRIGDAIYNIVISALSALGGAITALIASVPRAFLFVIITLISSVYFALDLERINSYVIGLLPSGADTAVRRFKNGFMCALGKYIRSYILLFLITFFVMLIGLSVLRVPYALLLAAVISFLDMLPVLGVGTFLIPYGVFGIIFGDAFLGVGILILFAVHTVIRQFAEPKIVGKSLGVHPIVTLVVLYAGYMVFGIFGLLLMPLFTVLLEIAFGKKDAAEVGEHSVREGSV